MSKFALSSCTGFLLPNERRRLVWQNHKHFKDVPETRRFETPYRSLQGQLWELDETVWYLATRLPDYAPRKRRRKQTLYIHQLELLEESQGT